MKDRFKGITPIILLCLTLGLAPFSPEPHIVGKIRWVMGGAKGMQGIDWGDLLLHGFPWLLLLAWILVYGFPVLGHKVKK